MEQKSQDELAADNSGYWSQAHGKYYYTTPTSTAATTLPRYGSVRATHERYPAQLSGYPRAEEEEATTIWCELCLKLLL